MRGLVALLLVLWACPAWADTHAAASCSSAHVQAAVTAASSGDTVTIPAGSCAWTSGVTVADDIGITITGAGTPTSSPSTFGASASCTATTITLTGTTGFTATPTYGAPTMRISCLQITYGSEASAGLRVMGTCAAGGCPSLRVDNITFTNWSGHSIAAGLSGGINGVGNMFGVIDHNTITGGSVGAAYLHFGILTHGAYLGVGSYGDNAWAQPEDYGTLKFLFVENNSFVNAGVMESEGSPIQGDLLNKGGARTVVRFNQFTNMDYLQFAHGWHGTESDGRMRSPRAFEVYQNSHTCVDPVYYCAPLVSPRGGTGIVWGNTLGGGFGVVSVVDLTTYRILQRIQGWGPCDGTSTFDSNDATTYWSGTIASASYDANTSQWTIGTSGDALTAGAWVYYSMHDSSINNGSIIMANTTSSLTVKTLTAPGTGPPPGGPVYAVGDSIQIRRPLACIDQSAGRGQGVLLTSGDPPDPVAVNQALSPMYVWANTFTTGPANYVRVTPFTTMIARNDEYYVENVGQVAQTTATTPFDGTTTIGFGHGTIALRPTTCTTGVGYWATDEGEWNSNQSGADGRLYLCTATNTWTLSYTPYTYPHPVVSGAEVAPNAPTNVRIR